MTDNTVQVTSVDRLGQELVEDVFSLFVDLLIAGGTSFDMIKNATVKALMNVAKMNAVTTFTELGSIQRDCMEVMCTWRRDTRFIDANGDPLRLRHDLGDSSFGALCKCAGCRNETSAILRTLIDFGAVSVDRDERIVSETPTFLLGRAQAGGRLAVDGVLKQLEGFLRVVHRNVCSVSGEQKPRFERACTVSVAAELEPVFDRLVRDRGQLFIDTVDEWLERNAKRESESGRHVELGAGAYFIDLGSRTKRMPDGQ